MPLPKAGDKQTTERLEELYDDYCKIAFTVVMTEECKPTDSFSTMEDHPEYVARICHSYATAMLNERNKK